jgi:cell division protein FtsW (lipid II flippase)
VPFLPQEDSFRRPTVVATAVEIARRLGPAWWVLISSALLTLIGILAIDTAESLTPGRLGPLATRQLVALGIGLAATLALFFISYRSIGNSTWIIYALASCLLVFLLIPGVPASIVRPRGGARAWIDLGPLNFQPSEVMKIAYVIVLAWYLRYSKHHRTFSGLLPPAILTALPLGLIMLQPDLGTALLFVPALFCVLIAAGAKFKHLTIVVLLAALAAPAAYPLLKPYQKQRIAGLFLQFKGDSREDLDINMQGTTAQRLIGAGRFFGVGGDDSRKLQHYNALPARHNDMIYAGICNRWGILGGVAVLGLFILWIAGALWTALLCPEPFGRLVCVGLAGLVAGQVIVNVGMNLGLLPIIGITLPFVSNGGSSLLAQWIMCGLIASVALHKPAWQLGKSFEWDE